MIVMVSASPKIPNAPAPRGVLTLLRHKVNGVEAAASRRRDQVAMY